MDAEKKTLNVSGFRAIGRDFFLTAVFVAVLFGARGDVGWTRGWIWVAVFTAYQVIHWLILVKVNPEMVNSRGKVIGSGTKFFDKVFAGVFVFLSLGMAAVAGLDGRFQWSSVTELWIVPAACLFVLVNLVGTWGMAVNRYFEWTVRIQNDRGHVVCQTGPYAFIRHPGYAAVVLSAPLHPLIVGSLWLFVPALLTALVLLVRTKLEDDTLQKELQGYAEYAQTTKYRIFPGVF